MTVCVWLLAAPVLLISGVLRSVRRCKFWSVAYRPSLRCPTCNAAISLVGMWECHCGYTYVGHVLRTCPVCGSLPRMVRCFSCGATAILPQP
jgi:hypothetical protein